MKIMKINKTYSTLFILLISSPCIASIEKRLAPYKKYLEEGTFVGWNDKERRPKSRYETFLYSFNHFEKHHGKTIVELGTSRSFVHGGLQGCNSNDRKYWTPNNPENWDWGAGFFTRMAASSLTHLNPVIHTIDIAQAHINRCKHMTQLFNHLINYHVISSVDFLKRYQGKIDLLYIDTGDMWPIEPTARLQLEEAIVIVQRNLLTDNGIILIDDVKNQTPRKFGETSRLGKAKYSIPYFLKHGFEIVMNEYQVILRRK